MLTHNVPLLSINFQRTSHNFHKKKTQTAPRHYSLGRSVDHVVVSKWSKEEQCEGNLINLLRKMFKMCVKYTQTTHRFQDNVIGLVEKIYRQIDLYYLEKHLC